MDLPRRLGALSRIAFPIILQSLVSYIMVFTDQAFLGQYRLDSLSALSNATGPYFMLTSFFLALGAGTTILISQAIGANRPLRARKIAENSFFFHQLICLVYLAFWLTCGRALLTLIGASGEILNMGTTFVTILAFTYLWTGPATAAASVFQGQGQTTPLMVVSLVKSLLNILLDWLLIFGHWGFPELGVAGAALATTVADLTGTIILLAWLFRRNQLGLNWKEFFQPRWRFYWQVLRIGLPNGLEYSLWAAGQVGLLAMLNRIGPLAAGFAGLLSTLTNFSVNIYFGLALAAMTLAGKATGARDPREAVRWGNLATFLSLAICTATGLAYLLFPQAIISLFSHEASFIATFQGLIVLVVATTFPKAINIVIGAAIRGTGNTRWMLYTQIFGTLFVIATSAGLIFGLGLGLLGLVWTNFLDETIRAIINWAKFRTQRRGSVNSKG